MSATPKKLDAASRVKLETEKAGLLEKRSELMERADALAAAESMTSEDAATLSGLSQEIKGLDSRLTAVEEQLAMDAADDASEAEDEARSERLDVRSLPQPPQAPRPAYRPAVPAFVRDVNDRKAKRTKDLAFRAWALGSQATLEMRSAAREIRSDYMNPAMVTTLFNDPKMEVRATTDPQATTPLAAGGGFIPTDFVREVEKFLLYVNPIRNIAKVLRTNGGNPMTVPYVNDTGSAGGGQLAENTADTVRNIDAATITLGGYPYSSGIVLCSKEFLMDEAVNAQQLLAELLGERLSRGMGTSFAVGNGATAPQGFITGGTLLGTTAGTGVLAVDDLLDLQHSVDLAYRMNATWVMHDTTLKVIRKLRLATTGEPVFQESYRDGSPGQILGSPVVIDNNVASATTANTKIIAYGDFSKFWIRDSKEIEVVRSDERYFEFRQSAFAAYSRTDSKVINSSAIKVLAYK